MIAIDFTPHEAEALRHRVEVADCIVQVFADTDGLDHYTEADVDHACARLALQLHNGKVRAPDDDKLLEEVLVELVEGSTWNACHDCVEVSTQRRTAAARALQSAANKIARAYGREPLDVPGG